MHSTNCESTDFKIFTIALNNVLHKKSGQFDHSGLGEREMSVNPHNSLAPLGNRAKFDR